MNFSRTRQPAGLILLVVLSMLAFLSVLVVAYVSFSGKSQRTSFALASREFHAPPVDDLFEEALMKLVRGTNDPADPFYGEDLLSDLYGREDGYTLGVATGRAPVHIGGAFVQVPVNFANLGAPRPNWTQFDDAFSGRVITFRGGGPLANQSFRVLRSTGVRQAGPDFVVRDSFFIELAPDLVVSLNDGTTVDIARVLDGAPNRPGGLSAVTLGELFQDRNGDPAVIHVNPSVHNGPGVGLVTDGNQLGANGPADVGRLAQSWPVPGLGVRVPLSFLPNSRSFQYPNRSGNPSDPPEFLSKGDVGGDYDEAYDAPDYSNWFLAGRVRVPARLPDGTPTFQDRIIPSFHRPSVLNYLINTKDWSNSPTNAEVRGVAQALSRATFRPLPFANQHPGFSGGSADFALSTPFQLPSDNNSPADDPLIARLDRLFDAVIRGNGNAWDVDNDGDGVPDSIWVDIGLPLITSPEGKLLRPLIAPMIEDTGGKLNLNAHGNYAQVRENYRTRQSQAWAGTTQDQQAEVARGLGYGPAEIALPSQGRTGNVSDGAFGGSVFLSDTTNPVNDTVVQLLRERSHWGSRPKPQVAYADGTPIGVTPGTYGNDALDALRTADRRRTHTAAGGVGFSSDPYGHGGIGVGRTGQLLASVSGTELQAEDLPNGVRAQTFDESFNDPYELDPTGRLDGDSVYLFDELEGILRDNSWDNDLLPTRLRTLLRNSLDNRAGLARMLTTLSTSFDHPNAVIHTGTDTRQDFYSDPANLGPAQLAQVLYSRLDLTGTPTEQNTKYQAIVAPELRLSRKIDVNRPFGNGDDDNNNGVIDEPLEFGNGIVEFYNDPDINTFPHPRGWNNDAYPLATSGDLDPTPGGPIQTRFGERVPDYNFGQRDVDLSASGRELLARHLYVLMMALLGERNAAGDRYEIPVEDPDTIDNRRLYNARRIAQWAVNVVDYRDQDAIMTRFVYDPFPLNGWDIADDTIGDGMPDAILGNPNADPDRNGLENGLSPVVWGVESPELVFSEGHAFHDVRVRDTNLEGGGGGSRKDPDDPMADNDTDQVRIPQGSLFLELYCNRAWPNGDMPHLQGVPQELYRLNGANQFELRLDARAPSDTIEQYDEPDRQEWNGAPVWRIAISEPHYLGSPNNPGPPEPNRSPQDIRAQYPDTASFDPERPLELDDGSGLIDTPLEYDRIIVFNHVEEATVDDFAAAMSPPPASGRQTILEHQIFFAHDLDNAHLNGLRGVRPGQYLGLGPRTFTNFGSQIFLDGSEPDGPSPIGFKLQADGFIQYGRGEDNRITPSTALSGPISPSVGMVIKTFRPDTFAANVFERGRVGLNVSEPLPRGPAGYYPAPLEHYGDDTVFTLRDAYVDISEDPPTTSPLDVPQDIAVVSPDGDPTPIGALSILHGTIPEPFIGLQNDYCSAFLQRLADPLKPYNVVSNPYITVDWMTIDLTSFSGEEEQSKIMEGADPGVTEPRYARQMRARNGCDSLGNPRGVLFSYNTDEPDGLGPNDRPGTTPNPGGGNPARLFTGRSSYFELDTVIGEGGIDSSFGYLNVGTRRFGGTLGASNGNTVMDSRDRGQPVRPFSLHPWLNRPFATHFELMMVPASSPGRLFEEYTPINPETAPDLRQRYPERTSEMTQTPGFPGTPPTSDPIDDDDISQFRGEHGHLLNFFQGSELEDEAAQFPRIFDYVTTLPRFRGEVELINPSRVSAPTGTPPPPPAAVAGSAYFRGMFQSPFNFLHDGRRQGQINLNTLSDYPVWIGLMHGHLIGEELQRREGDIISDADPRDISFQEFLRSRRGYPVVADPPLPNTNQRRIFGGGNIQPRPTEGYNYAPDMLDGRFPTQYAGMFRNIADADLAPVLPEIAGQPPKLARAGVVNSLLRRDVEADAAWDSELPELPTPFFVRKDQNDAHRDVDRNPFAHYQTLMRMPNLVTNNSQVFIVRVTMGFFEVDPNSTGSLGREYKEEIAENERYQMLYLIDRSKPVGFVPGEDLNARDVVVYERRLQ